MPPKYKALPKLNEWKDDCCDPQAGMFTKLCKLYKLDPQSITRLKGDLQQDVTMNSVYEMLLDNEMNITDAGGQTWLLFGLYQALLLWKKKQASSRNGWKKLNPFQKKNAHLSGLLDIRGKAVANLFDSICFMLANRLGCTINTLPNKIELYFLKGLGAHGVKLDLKDAKGDYYKSRGEINKYRIVFDNKKAYMLPWWDKKSDATTDTGIKFVLANTKYAHELTPDKAALVTVPDESFGILDKTNQFYTAPHGGKGGPDNDKEFFHSSYTAGDDILCSGSMAIKDGVFTFLSNKSGHYTPPPINILHYLNALSMNGALHDDITIEVALHDAPSQLFKSVSDFKQWLNNDWSTGDKLNNLLTDKAREQRLMHGYRNRWGSKHVKEFGHWKDEGM